MSAFQRFLLAVALTLGVGVAAMMLLPDRQPVVEGTTRSYMFAYCQSNEDTVAIARAFSERGWEAAVDVLNAVHPEGRYCMVGFTNYPGVQGELKWAKHPIVWTDGVKVTVMKLEPPHVAEDRSYAFMAVGAINGGSIPKPE